jgi:hypothetical protein
VNDYSSLSWEGLEAIRIGHDSNTSLDKQNGQQG